MSLLSTTMQLVSLLLAFVFTVLAKPLAFRPRDAISPPITNPTASSIWKAGDMQTVTWDLSGLNGAQPSNPIGKVILGTFINGEEHLMLESPLASGFNILDGNVTLTVPTVTTGSDYIVCLFGSSGDISAPFTIIGTDASTSASAPASASASTQLNAASSSNTLPPHQTTDPSTTTISLPHGVPITGDPSSASATSASASVTGSSSTTAVVSVPSSAVPSSGTSAASSTATSPSVSPTATSAGASSTGTGTGTGTATAAASTSTGNSGARMAVTNVHLWGALSGVVTLFAFL